MGRFVTDLHVTPVGNRRWRLLAPLAYDASDGIAYIVPPGFVTDFASVPRAWWWLIPPTGRYAAAAALHDWLYAGDRGVTRRQADALFREAMEVAGVSRWTRTIMYAAVRVGGVNRGHWSRP